MLNSPTPHKNGLWARVAAQALYIIAFGGIMGAVGMLVPALVNGAFAVAAAGIGLSAAIGLVASIGSTYINGKIETQKENSAHPIAEKNPLIIIETHKTSEPMQTLSDFRERLEAERARRDEASRVM